MTDAKDLEYHFGKAAGLVPLAIFIVGVITVALLGAPDEKSFWPILFLALTAGLVLAKDKKQFGETVFEGMSQKLVPLMITAWIIASSIGVLMSDSGLVSALIALGARAGVDGAVFILITLVICCVVSLSTGSSFATILICGPILYPAGGQLGAHLPTLAGAIMGGATFGDFIAPVSDTTIASAVSMKQEIGEVVRSRLRLVLPAMLIALVLYVIAAVTLTGGEHAAQALPTGGSYRGLLMLLTPALIIYLFLKEFPILYALLMGLSFGVVTALAFGLIGIERVFSLDPERFTATSFIIDGVNRAVGISIFTLLLMGLVATVLAGGAIRGAMERLQERIDGKRQTGLTIAGVTSLAVLLTTHSIVAILSVAEFVAQLNARHRYSPVKAANIMSSMACAYPFLLPYFVPVLLMVNISGSGAEYGVDKVGALEAGLFNFVSWGILVVSIFYIFQKKSD
ncbi:MAG: Na+/H+ antiporter NhaC family protein [Rhodothermales bacterium]